MNRHSKKPDSIHRLTKLMRGKEGGPVSISEAEAIFNRWRVTLVVDPELLEYEQYQCCFLTALNASSRVFRGGVNILGLEDQELKSHFPLCSNTLREAARKVADNCQIGIVDNSPRIILGATKSDIPEDCFAVRLVWGGWRGGVCAPEEYGGFEWSEHHNNPLGSILAAALGVSEVFHWYYDCSEGHNIPIISKGLSLWRPDTTVVWSKEASDGPLLASFPENLWLVGLGNLGQAYLWTLSALPYADTSRLRLMLQDTDFVTKSTLSTSVLSHRNHIGMLKAAVCYDWAVERGFNASMSNRIFDQQSAKQKIHDITTLGGVDNIHARREICQAQFCRYIDGALGAGHSGFCDIQVRSFRNGKPATPEIWKRAADDTTSAKAIELSEQSQVYVDLGELDRCGAIEFQGTQASTPFVGLAASTIVVSEALRQYCLSAPKYGLIAWNIVGHNISCD